MRLVLAIIALANTLELPVVAEGIESAAMAETLARLGCAMGQGFHFGHPLPVEAITAAKDGAAA